MKKIILSSCLLVCALSVFAQDRGYLTGSFESNNHLYVTDEANKFNPELQRNGERFGSNNYIKLDYYNGNFSAGLQMEGYYPALMGYPSELQKYALSNLYVNWKDENFQITAGTFYDQFGSGLLFRSWEDRPLGLNNALMGARFVYDWDGKITFKALWGMPRLGMEFSETQVRGADLSVSLSNLIGLDNILLSLEGSVLNKYEETSIESEEAGLKPNTIGYSARLNFDWNGFFLKGEYVDLGKRLVTTHPDPVTKRDVMGIKNGNVQLVELGYNKHGLGVTLTGRRLEWAKSSITWRSSSPANLLSYVPAMSTQYTYMLTTLKPYSPNLGGDFKYGSDGVTIPGEIGGQLDAFYNFRRGTALGGKRGMKIHANFSTYYTLDSAGSFNPRNLLLRDFSFDVEKQWTKDFKMVLLYSMQEQNTEYGAYKSTQLSHIVVADLLYKWTKTFSTRMELQYLMSKEGKKDWMAALLEVNFAPHWSLWCSDMFNHGSTKMHYYNAGVSYSKGRTRLAAGYGRYMDGYICSGGVCRPIDSYTGANLTLTTSF